MQATQPLILSILVVVSFCLLPGCRSHSYTGRDSDHGTSSLRSKSGIEESSRRIESQARYASGLSYDLNREPAKAIEQYILAIRADPSNEKLAMEVSRRLVLAKQFEQALEVVELAASAPTASATVYAQLGVLYGELDRIEEAVTANRKAIEMDPTALISYHNLYTIYLRQDDKEQAVSILNEAAGQDSEISDFWLDLAELYANFYRNHPDSKHLVEEQMKACLSRANEIGVTGARRLRLADGYQLAGENQQAVDLLLELLEEYQDTVNRKNTIRQKLLSIYISTEDTEGALTQLESLVRDYPTNPQANFLLASYAMEKRDSTKAVEYFRKTIQLDPGFEQAYYSLAGLLLDDGKPDESVALLETARGRFDKSFILEYYSALGYGMLEAHEAALEHYTNAEIIGRADSRVNLDHRFYFGLGAQQERMKLFDKAADTFQRCIDMKPDFAQALNYLGYMWADQGIELEKAREYIQKAVDLDPENSAFLDSLAWVLYKLDQPNLALLHMEDAIKFHADEEADAVLYDHLGDIHLALGNHEKARDAWKESIAIEENPTVQEKLDSLIIPVAHE